MYNILVIYYSVVHISILCSVYDIDPISADTSDVVDPMIVSYEETSNHDIADPPLTVESSSNGDSGGMPDFERYLMYKTCA